MMFSIHVIVSLFISTSDLEKYFSSRKKKHFIPENVTVAVKCCTALQCYLLLLMMLLFVFWFDRKLLHILTSRGGVLLLCPLIRGLSTSQSFLLLMDWIRLCRHEQHRGETMIIMTITFFKCSMFLYQATNATATTKASYLSIININKDDGNNIGQKAMTIKWRFTLHRSSWLHSFFLSGSRTPYGVFRSHSFSMGKKENTVVSEQPRRSTWFAAGRETTDHRIVINKRKLVCIQSK